MGLKGKWQKGNLWALSSDEMKIAFEKAGKGVKRPHSVETKGKTRWRVYYKESDSKQTLQD